MAHKKEGKERISDPRVDRIWEYMREKKINLTKLSKVSGLSYLHGSGGHGDRSPVLHNRHTASISLSHPLVITMPVSTCSTTTTTPLRKLKLWSYILFSLSNKGNKRHPSPCFLQCLGRKASVFQGMTFFCD